MHEDRHRALIATSRLLWLVTGLLLVVVVIATLSTSLRVTVEAVPLGGLLALLLAAIARFYTHIRRDTTIAVLADTAGVFLAFVMVGSVYTCVMTHLGGSTPFWDARLAGWDAALGFDWRGFLAWLDARPRLGAVLDVAYGTITIQAALMLLLLPLFGHHERLQVFVLAAQIGIVLCGLGATLTPAIGAYDFYAVVPAVDHPNIPLATRDLHVEQVHLLRGAAPVIDLASIVGIITFPSFHMTTAVLFVWAFWPLRWLRWPIVALNLAMAAATPLSGGHHLVDLLAGAPIGVVGILAGVWLRRRVAAAATGRGAVGIPAAG